MRERSTILLLIPILAAFGGVACGHSETSAAAEQESPRTAARRAHLAQTAPTEQAHSAPEASGPPPASPHGTGLASPPAVGSGTGASALVWSKPEAWVEEPPSSGMRRAQYRVPGTAGDAECIVYYFGAGQGGSAEANAERWAEQFKQPDGRPSTQAMKTTEIQSNGVSTLLVEVSGTYSGGMGPGMGGGGGEKPNQMLLGAIAAGPDSNWFFKLTGPAATVRAQEPAFKAMIGSLKKGS